MALDNKNVLAAADLTFLPMMDFEIQIQHTREPLSTFDYSIKYGVCLGGGGVRGGGQFVRPICPSVSPREREETFNRFASNECSFTHDS